MAEVGRAPRPRVGSPGPLKEAIDGEVMHPHIPKLQPVEDYLKLQGRFRQLFEPTVQRDAIAHIQERVNAYWAQARQNNRHDGGNQLI